MPRRPDDSQLLAFLRNAEQAGTAPPAAPTARPPRGSWQRSRLAASWDAVQTTDENQRHWQAADFFSARAAANIQVRRLFRNRSRYEYANNSYYQGMVLTLANHAIGKGPRLHVTTENAEFNDLVEAGWAAWSKHVGLAEQLRMSRQAKCVDGEIFAVMITNPRVPGPVQLDLRWYEGDQIWTPTLLQPLPTKVDGIEFDEIGNPIFYHKMHQHPGDMYFAKDPFKFDRLPADQVIHLFRTDRPWQARGIPEAAPALPLFAMLRRFTLATVAAAETAADFAAIMKTLAPAGKEAETLPEDEWFQAIPLEYRAMLTLPAGWDITQLEAKHPTTTHEMFVRALLREIARCLNMPYNVAAGDSSSYNYSSGRLDHQTYFKCVDLERHYYETRCLDRVLAAWLDEALLTPGYLPEVGSFEEIPHKWYWDAIEDIDPSKTAAADAQKLTSGGTNRARMYAEDGLDVDEEDARAAETYGCTVEEYRKALFNKTFGAAPAPAPANGAAAAGQQQDDDDDELDDSKETPDNKAQARAGRLLTASGEAELCGAEMTADTRLMLQAADQPGPDAAVAESPSEPPAPPKFSMVAYTGGRLFVPIRPHPLVVDLETIKIPPASLPVLRDHRLAAVVGHTTAAAVTGTGAGRRIESAGVLSGNNEHADEVRSSAQHGFPWQASIGANLRGGTEFVAKGEKAFVNGRVFEGPIYVARNAVLAEISVTALGADEGRATTTVAASGTPTDLETAMTFEQWLHACGLDAATLSEAQRTGLQARFDATAAAEKRASDLEAKLKASPPTTRVTDTGTIDPEETVKQMRLRASQESERIAKINDVCKLSGQVQLEAKAICEGWSLERTELECLRASRLKPGSAQPQADKGAFESEVLEASLILATGQVSEEALGEHYSEEVMNKALSKKHRGMTLHAAMDLCLFAAGRAYHGNRKSEEFIRATFEADNFLRATDGFTTLSLSNILENAAGKMLLASYTAVEVTWPYIAAPRSHVDFKVHSRYRLDSNGAFRKVGPDGELKMIGLSDAKYSSQLDTYGAIITLNRQMFFNDDLGSFMYIPAMLGRLAALRIEEAGYTLLLSNPNAADGQPFFSAAHGNLINGAGSALQISALTTARQNFRNRVDTNGKPILIDPNILLVGTGLETIARQLWAEEKVMVTTSADVPRFNNNPFKGMYQPYISPYLNNASITNEAGVAIAGQSNTLWYLFADPAIRAALAVAFLNGSQTPVLQFSETNFNVLGMSWRAFHDFAMGLEDYNAALQSAGA